MITPMENICIVCPKKYGYPVLDTLYNLHLFHCKDYKQGELPGAQLGKPLNQAEHLSKSMLIIRSLKKALGMTAPPRRVLKSRPFSERVQESLTKKITELNDKITSYHDTLNKQQKHLEILQREAALAAGLGKLLGSRFMKQEMRHVAIISGTINDAASVKKKCRELNINTEIKHCSIRNEALVVIVSKMNDKDRLLSALSSTEFKIVDPNQIREMDIVTKELKQLAKQMSDVQHNLKTIARQECNFLSHAESLLEEEIKKAELPLQFAQTAQSIIATGYVPTSQIEHITKEITKVTDGHVMIEHHKPHHGEEVPVMLHNPKAARNFEALTRLYELPSYFEVDPSSLMLLTFPLFFGFMLGDVGYGLVTLGLFVWLKKKIPSAGQLLNILTYAAIVTIIFGLVFGEYFGFEHISAATGAELCKSTGLCLHKEIIQPHGENMLVYSFPRLISRMTGTATIFGMELLSVLVIGVIAGAVHVNLGLAVGLYNVYRAHGLMHAILEKMSWFVLEAGLLLTTLALAGILIQPMLWIGIGIVSVSVVLLYMGEGAKGIIEIPALFSNMLSYMRLGAVGLSSVGLAVVINENLAKPFLEKGGIFILLAGMIMVTGHIVNIGLGVLGPFLHGIRLHYVEFFTKFFHGGGGEYNPFGYDENK